VSLPKLIAKYSVSGVINTVVGYTVIFGCMAFGVGATLANIIGYAVGVVCSFLQSRYWVFRSSDSALADALRFIPGFLVAYAVNMVVLQVTLRLGINPYLCQLCAGAAYTACGFAINHWFVFQRRKI
jgi:putative flippase GtrA